MARNVVINYGGYIVGLGATDGDVHLTDKMHIEIAYDKVLIAFRVHITTAGDLATIETAMKAAYRDIDTTLVVSIGGTERVNIDPATNSGFLTRASMTKPGDAYDTAQSSMWDIEIVAALPADKAGRAGRQKASIVVRQAPSELRVATFTGVFTALPGKTAIQQFEENVTTWITDTLDGLKSGEDSTLWQEQRREYNIEDQNKVLTFTVIYEEINFPESTAGLNHEDIVSQVLSYAVSDYGYRRSAHYPFAVPLTYFRMAYNAYIKKSVTDLKTFFNTTIRAHLLNTITSELGGTPVVEDITIVPELSENRIAATISGWIVSGSIIHARVSHSMFRKPGIILSDAWDGNEYAKELDAGLGEEFHEMEHHLIYLGNQQPSLAGIPAFLVPPKYHLIAEFVKEEPWTQGRTFAVGTRITGTEFVSRRTFRRGDPVQRGGGTVERERPRLTSALNSDAEQTAD